ncbi:MAG: hypothetical protein ACKVTZ_19775, partial [Bacteroidia bacterium]
LELLEFTPSQCDNTENAYKIQDRIVFQAQHGDTLSLEIGFAYTCCSAFIPEISYEHDTLYISYDGGQVDPCKCNCCFSFFHKIKGIPSQPFVIKFENKVITKRDKYETVKKAQFTRFKGKKVNLTDQYNMKQGLWMLNGLEQKVKEIEFERYLNDFAISSGKSYKNGNVKFEYNWAEGKEREYYPSGKLKRECTLRNQQKTCEEW